MRTSPTRSSLTRSSLTRALAWLCLALLLGVSLLEVADARRRKGRRRARAARADGWLKGPEALARARQALSGCRTLSTRELPANEELVERGGSCRFAARVVGEQLELRRSVTGAGSDGATTGRVVHVDTATCKSHGLSYLWPHGALSVGVRLLGHKEAVSQPLCESGGFVAADPQSAAQGAARLVASLGGRCAVFAAKGARRLVPIQPARPGRPQGSPPTIWSRQQLRGLGVAMPSLEHRGRAGALAVTRVERPKRVHRVRGTSLEIHRAALPGRRAGALLALYDRRRRQHRWLLPVSGCLVGQAPRWLGQRKGWLVGVAMPADPGLEQGSGQLLLIRLGDGLVAAAPLPALEGGGEAQRPSARLRGDRLQLRRGSKRELLRLDPILAGLTPPT